MSTIGVLGHGAEEELAGVGLEQQLDALLDLHQPLRELPHEGDAALEDRQRVLECQLALLEPLDDPFELGERLLEARGGFRLCHHSSVASMRARARPRAKRTTTASPGASAAASRTMGPPGAPWRTIA